MRKALSCAGLFALLCTVMQAAIAQPFSSNEGMRYAEPIAKDSIGSDAVHYATFAFGIDPITFGQAFDMTTGLSSHWVYRYYSPSRNRVYQHVLYKSAPDFFSGVGGIIAPDAGVSAAIAIDTNGSHANSTMMAASIRNNPVYQTFRYAHEFVLILVETFTKGTAPIPGMPNDFDWNDERWTLVFQDANDTTQVLYCFVAASAGTTYCIATVATGIRDESGAATLRLRVAPNPAFGDTRVSIAAPHTSRDISGVRIGLFNSAGQQVLDLSEAFVASGHRSATFDASELPAGTYYCRAVGAGFNGVAGTIVIGR